MDKAYVVPLHELLAGVPRGTRLEINDPDGMGTRFIPVGRYCHEAAEALRAALAQPDVPETAFGETEPVAWMHNFIDDVIIKNRPTDITCNAGRWTALYTAPPQREWQGLTDKVYEAMAEQYVTNCYFDTLKYAKAIEAKLKDNNYDND